MTTTAQSGLNVRLLNRALGRIIASPKNWNQGQWIGPIQGTGNYRAFYAEVNKGQQPDLCKTAFCLAGHTLLESGKYTVVVDEGVVDIRSKAEPDRSLDYVTEAGDLLGIGYDQARYLFLRMMGYYDPQEFVTAVRNYLGVKAPKPSKKTT